MGTSSYQPAMTGFLRTTMTSDWMTVVWDKVDMEGKKRDMRNTAVVDVKEEGKSNLEYFS